MICYHDLAVLALMLLGTEHELETLLRRARDFGVKKTRKKAIGPQSWIVLKKFSV